MKKIMILALGLMFASAGFSQTAAAQPVKKKTPPSKTQSVQNNTSKSHEVSESSKTSKAAGDKANQHHKADGTPDKRYSENRHTKADGTLDKRYKGNKKKDRSLYLNNSLNLYLFQNNFRLKPACQPAFHLICTHPIFMVNGTRNASS